MTVRTPTRSIDEIDRLGEAAFTTHVQPKLRAEDDGLYVAVDVDSGDFEIDEDDITAVDRLRQRRPTAEVWLAMAGEPAAYKLRAGR